MSDTRNRLELGTPVFANVETAAAVSTAISLKRIADTLEKLSKTGGGSTLFQMGYDFAAGIEQVGFSIGQQIERGRSVG